MIPSLISNTTDKSVQGEVLGLSASALAAGRIASPFLSGLLYDISKEIFADNLRLLPSLPCFVGSGLLLITLPLLFLPSLRQMDRSRNAAEIDTKKSATVPTHSENAA